MNKKIIFIASYPESLINFRLQLINEFLQRNFSVVVLAPKHAEVELILIRLGIRYIPIDLERNGINPLNDLFLIKKLYEIIKSESPDITFGYTIKPVIYGTIAAKLAKVPKIFSMLTGTGYVFSNDNLKNKIIGFIAKKLFKFALKFNTKLFFQNKDNLASFKEHKLIDGAQPIAIVNGSGVDVNFFSPVSFPQRVSFLMIARLLKDKGVREYVAAARMLKGGYPNISFKLVGWIDTNPNSISKTELNQWIQDGVIEYIDKLSDVRGVIELSSVYVLPSYGEGTPRTVLEAMAMGRPIVTTDVPGCRETVVEGQNGFLVQARNVQALSKAMEHFIKNPDDIKKMGNMSRGIAVEKYDVNKVNYFMLNEMEVQNEINPKDILETTI